jgi:type IV secretory pathway TrbL component
MTMLLALAVTLVGACDTNLQPGTSKQPTSAGAAAASASGAAASTAPAAAASRTAVNDARAQFTLLRIVRDGRMLDAP